jgi:hypothetical protein
LSLTVAAVGAGATVFALRADAQPQLGAQPQLATQPYELTCWQDGMEIVSVQEDRALQSFSQADVNSLTIENADGSRRVLKPMGESLCMLEFSASRS